MFQEFTGKQYLKIDIANNFGHDKLLWQERIDWFDAHEAQLMTLLPKAEKPALCYAGIQAWEAMKAGLPSGLSNLAGCLLIWPADPGLPDG